MIIQSVSVYNLYVNVSYQGIEKRNERERERERWGGGKSKIRAKRKTE